RCQHHDECVLAIPPTLLGNVEVSRKLPYGLPDECAGRKSQRAPSVLYRHHATAQPIRIPLRLVGHPALSYNAAGGQAAPREEAWRGKRQKGRPASRLHQTAAATRTSFMK